MEYTLLIVDDDEAILTLLKKLFEKKYTVFTANDGVEAISFLSQRIIPDLIISDLNMENINGYEFIKHVSTSSILNDIPVIILSNISEDDIGIVRKLPVVVKVLNKPFDPITLLHIVNEVLYKAFKKTLIGSRISYTKLN